jgi:hypothetical protein
MSQFVSGGEFNYTWLRFPRRAARSTSARDLPERSESISASGELRNDDRQYSGAEPQSFRGTFADIEAVDRNKPNSPPRSN